MKRRQLIKGILATGALSMVNNVDAMNLLVNDDFWSNIRNSFPKKSEYINLLNTGGGAVSNATLELLSKYQEITAGGGENKTQALNSLKESGSSQSLRQLMANTFGCSSNEIALTRNAMEGLVTGLLGLDLDKNDEIITTNADYDSCIRIIEQREKRDNIRLKLIDIPMHAKNDDEVVSAFENSCTNKTKVILMCHMFNKNGQILPIRRICEMAKKKGITTIVDGAQSIGQIDFKISELGCDIFSASLHKWFYAPKGTGILYVRKDSIENVWPIYASWSGKPNNSIEKFEEYGTVSKAISASLPSVFEFNQKIGIERKEKRLRYLRDLWLNEILKSDRVRLLTNPKKSCAITAFKIEGINPNVFSKELYDKHKISIGSIHLQDKPNFKGNYLAADLTNSEEEIYKFIEVFKAYIKQN
ncbi:aminotransferase class V-fold PLP-dependent enzyme [Tenacibaculum xiamenense]|uniref:aminotransferase class V-fold PLP-dependent enzyme n=1 Tax=Tenacibaculum xiamenense TaxID=1261553 RepID=UPI003893F8D0